MQTCGMYNGAGKFTKDHGVPSKSGVSGALMTVIPGIGAVGSYSPPLNDEGNSVRGIGMIEKLNSLYINFNLFYKDQTKKDVTRMAYQTLIQSAIAANMAASTGDLETLMRLKIKGVDLNLGDYDKRTPLHIAVSAGHKDVVELLLQEGVEVNSVDRWGATPLNDA